ncbi:MAG: competence protein ComEC family protein, partial [Oscillospiraceae bacterium]|nr:competence protein ComEC family protein [Oscillospiraceae bacterium]
MTRPFAVIGFSMLLVLAVLFFLPEEALWAVLAFCAVGLTVCLLLPRGGEHKRVFCAAFASGLVACLLLMLQLSQVYLPSVSRTGEALALRAVVTGNVEARYGRYYYAIRITSIDGRPCRLNVRFSGKTPLYAAPYDEISYQGSLYPLGGEDEESLAQYRAKGVYLGSYAQGYAEDTVAVTATQSIHPMKAALRLRQWIKDALTQSYPEDLAALLRGMLLGDKSGLSWQTDNDFRRTGISHLFAVSGIHMSLLAWSVFRLLQRLRLRKRAAALLASVFVLLFMAVTGFTASCVRAGIMMLVLLGGEIFRRKPDSLNSLGFAALLLCVASPLSAGQVGLQLSFGATLGILLFHRPLCAPLCAWTQALRPQA